MRWKRLVAGFSRTPWLGSTAEKNVYGVEEASGLPQNILCEADELLVVACILSSVKQVARDANFIRAIFVTATRVSDHVCQRRLCSKALAGRAVDFLGWLNHSELTAERIGI